MRRWTIWQPSSPWRAPTGWRTPLPDTFPPAEAWTLACDRHDYPEWHRGRPRYAVWALALSDPAVQVHRDRVRAALQPWLLDDGGRQPHVTLQICGFPAAASHWADDFSHAVLEAQAEALVRSDARPFGLTVGAAFSFRSAACLSVHDPGQHLAPLRQTLAQADRQPNSIAPDAPYAPHVTVGLYNGAWPLQAVHSRLAALDLPDVPIGVQALDWMCYDSRVIGGPLRTLLRIDLARRAVQVPDAAALARVFSCTGAEGP